MWLEGSSQSFSKLSAYKYAMTGSRKEAKQKQTPPKIKVPTLPILVGWFRFYTMKQAHTCNTCHEPKDKSELRLKKNGTIKESICKSCRIANIRKYEINKRPYYLQKKDHCERCGFTGHPVQLDVDHINGDHNDNSPDNLMTLCANCHRLKSLLSPTSVLQYEQIIE